MIIVFQSEQLWSHFLIWQSAVYFYEIFS